MNKRIRFIITSIILSGGFFALSFLENQDRFVGIAALSVFSVVLFVWALFEGLGKNATLFVLILPVLYTLGVGLFWFLLPATILATLPVIILYGVGIYALCLTTNIFTVSTIRTIALSRAAKGVGFVLTLFTAFLLYDALLSLRVSPIYVVPASFVISFPLLLQGLWSSQLEKRVDKGIVLYAFIFSFEIACFSLITFFWPLSLIESSLLLTVATYVFLGLGQAKIEGRLFKTTVREYAVVGIMVMVFMILSTSWRAF